MHFFAIAVGLLALMMPLFALPHSEAEVLEQLRGIPDGWIQGAAPAASTPLKLRIAVHQPRQAEFEQLVIDMSTPDHPSYGQHMKRDQMKAFLRPSKEVSEAILGWLRSEGVPEADIEDDGDWINFKVAVGKAESMLNTHFYYFQNKDAGIQRIRTLQYSIPLALHGYVQMIQPTTRFGQLRPQVSMVMDSFKAESEYHPSGYNATFCNYTVTPDCLRGLYQLDGFLADPNVGNSLGISGFLDQYAQYAELERFVNEYATYARNASFDVVSINGGLNTQNVPNSIDTGEANLDMQYGIALSYNTPVTYYTTGGLGLLVPDLDQPDAASNQNEPYLDQLQYLLSLDDDKLPKVLTTSYGEDEQSVPEEYSRSVCSLFAQLGSRGTSVIFASGDTGVGSACQTNDGKNTTRFLPIFPAACPFVTSVGGTQHVEPEEAVSFSSGGFSDRFPRPAYQEDAVGAYLDRLGDTWAGLYNPDGRGFPDVAAQAVNYSVYDKGVLKKFLGTSASAPTFAAIVADLNSILLSKGKPQLGFLNPWIYQKGYKGLTDIVDGGSRGCRGFSIYSGLPAPRVPNATWAAVEGWDPVTGYGTPIFPKLVQLIDVGGNSGGGSDDTYSSV
ncbi:hypothetical protein EPUS_05321 [Endocarpon pusillum Z07020]|uniref:tripeptidyl-peptidase II n=1 Tax=Endocarpon pusillum (strain Z07020 / HMAS-L-300199) TaxID=1263415 RepID=U1HQB6_ENDPU|nr:uncharacterized protein EPUS_05321 [Endocarpon pusillum Z07020]ERF71269.1 hypothetical protein EPUS_05321 [Endocarpon pusillum Z07020]